MSTYIVRAFLVCLIAADAISVSAATILLKRPPGIAAIFLAGTENEFGVRAVANQMLGILRRAPQFAPRIPPPIPTDIPCPNGGICIVYHTPLLGIPDGDLTLVPGVPVTMATHILRPWVKEPDKWDLRFVEDSFPPQLLTINLNVAGIEAYFSYEVEFETFDINGTDSPFALLQRKMANLSVRQLSPNPVIVDLGPSGQLEVSIHISSDVSAGVTTYASSALITSSGSGSLETTFLLHAAPEPSTLPLLVLSFGIASGRIRRAKIARF